MPPRSRRPVDWDALAQVALPPLEPAAAEELEDGAELEARDLDGLRDADDVRLLDCRIRGRADPVRLRRSALRNCLLDEVHLATLTAPDAGWTDVVIRGSRLGALVVPGGRLTRVTLERVRVDYLQLRGAQLGRVQLVDCAVGELDLGLARADEVRLPGSQVDKLVLQGAELTDVDLRGAGLGDLDGLDGLRGAVVDGGQLQRLAPALATHLGLRVTP